MPNLIKFFPKPKLKPSKGQLKALVERSGTIKGVIPPEAALIPGLPEEIFKFKPPVTREVGELTTRHPEPGMGISTKLPYEEAQRVFFSDPERYIPGAGAPPAKILRRAIPGEAAEIGGGLAYERQVQRPVATEAGYKQFLKFSHATEIQNNDAQADRLWGLIGGGRSIGGKQWESFRRVRERDGKQVPETGHQFFKACFVDWRDKPKLFKKNFKKEATLLEKIWDVHGPSAAPAAPIRSPEEMSPFIERYLGRQKRAAAGQPARPMTRPFTPGHILRKRPKLPPEE